MKKNKTVAYLLAATLLVGGTFMGTKAYFTDKEESYNDLVITMGNLNVDVDEGEWVNSNPNTEATNATNNDRFTNVKPGDRFTKTIKITNNGTLKQKLTVSGGNISEELHGDVLVGQSFFNNVDGKELKPGESVEAIIDVMITKETPGAFGDTEHLNLNQRPTFNFNDIMAPFEVSANQVN